MIKIQTLKNCLNVSQFISDSFEHPDSIFNIGRKSNFNSGELKRIFDHKHKIMENY